ncbi:hypothetical protein [Fimbriiglobus ruber]|uniref:Uncharacterized protein n=1 Tax=Fimbriiglobus ruber TaxID=1908690 RepID=A0A225E6J4_9BACT|nr:hypothetical protein [Fimbriiglobus ruber]OWK46428.1 hypothetical protein FRUB_00127 [Fimbriiglobus ruber]
MSDRTRFWLLGLFLTGITLVAIGLLLGSIGRAARKSELPPADATPMEATIQQTAAAAPHPVMPVNAVGMAPVPNTYPANTAAPMPAPVAPTQQPVGIPGAMAGVAAPH